MTEQEIQEKGYANPDALVSTQWVAEHLDDTENVRIVESDEDVLLYDIGHVPNSVKIDWVEDLNDPLMRDYLDPDHFANLMAELGISPDTTVIFYGDKNNWWATYALWVFGLFGHDNVKVMDGGRVKWEAEGREMTQEVASFHMPDYPQEGALRGGHIPGAANVPWARAVREDGTFKSADELKEIYEGEIGLSEGDDVIAYCRIGERSSHTWFVLKYLLGYEDVRNYDGSWTEWGNLVRAPIER